MPDAGLDAQRSQNAHPTDAEDDLLGDALDAVDAVEAARDAPVLSAVLGNVGVEKIEAATSHGESPDAHEDITIGQLDTNAQLASVAVVNDLEGHRREICPREDDLLLALRVEELTEVTVAVEERDTDERHRDIAGTLDVVSSEDSEPTRVNRQALVEPELHREVRHRCRRREPARRRHRTRRVTECLLNGPQPGVERTARGQRRELALAELAHENHRAATQRTAPRGRHHVSDEIPESAGLRAPGPPEVHGDALEAPAQTRAPRRTTVGGCRGDGTFQTAGHTSLMNPIRGVEIKGHGVAIVLANESLSRCIGKSRGGERGLLREDEGPLPGRTTGQALSRTP